ncbi:M48 family metalloprotease [Candidatus Berkelbacteria bacterium]|nr:M48 family metalloprotease [Candidatus Berkelbacteria bacterium]
MIRRRVGKIVWVCLVGFFFFVVTAPSASAFRLFKLGAKQEMSMGQNLVNQTDREYPPWQNPALESRVGEMVNRLLGGVERTGLAWQVSLYDTREEEGPIVNAFCAPGGYIRVFRGLAEQVYGTELIQKLGEGKTTPDDEVNISRGDSMLAAVIAHEIAHADLRHSVDGLQNDLGLAVLLGFLTGNDPSTIEQLAASFFSSKYSRKQETAADIAGLGYLYLAGYQPLGMVDMLRMLEGLGGNLPKPLSYLATHPNPGDRAKRISGLIPEVILTQGKNRPASEPLAIRIEITNLVPEIEQAGFQKKLEDLLNNSKQVVVIEKDEKAALLIEASAITLEILSKDKKGAAKKIKISGLWRYSIWDSGGETAVQEVKASQYSGAPAKLAKSWLPKEVERAAIFGLAHLLGYAEPEEEVMISLD